MTCSQCPAPATHSALLSPPPARPVKATVGGCTVKYRTLVVDPPWSYSLRQDDATHRGRCKYPMMGVDQLGALGVSGWAEPDAHLYIWTTNAFLVEAHTLAQAWGFVQKTLVTWCKTSIGLGNYYRNSTEHALFCVRGKLPVIRHDVPTHFTAPRGRHSAKPEAFYDMVESMSPGPYLDVFARRQRMGWDTWGNECFTPEGLAL